MKYLLCFTALAFVVSACDNPASNDIALDHGQEPTGFALPDASFHIPIGDNPSVEERMELVQGMSEGLGIVEEALYGIDDAKTADRRLTEAAANAHGVPQMVIQQLGSITMLERYLDNSALTNDQVALATKHVRTLTESGSPEVEVIADALDHLGDRIPSTERVRLAETAVASARRDEKPDDADRQTLQGVEARRQVVRRLEQVVANGRAVPP